MKENKQYKFLSIDPMTTFAWYNGDILGHHTCDKKKPAFSFYCKMLDLLRVGHGKCPYQAVVMEMTHFNYVSSQKILLGQRYILKMLTESLNIPLYEYSPASVKKSFTGSGRAEKTDIMSECGKRGIEITTHDEADAVALYHHHLTQKKDK